MQRLLNALILAVAFAVPPGFAADDFPVRPVRFIVPFPPGGGTDAFARVLGFKRNEALPDVPSSVEAGYPQLSDVVEWYGVIAPAATPRATIVKLNASVVRALRSPDVIERLGNIGQTAAPSTPEEFTKQIRAEFERWGKVVKASGAKVD